jgi:hypothetical protein
MLIVKERCHLGTISTVPIAFRIHTKGIKKRGVVKIIAFDIECQLNLF